MSDLVVWSVAIVWWAIWVAMIALDLRSERRDWR